jgi:hypothetical protein
MEKETKKYIKISILASIIITSLILISISLVYKFYPAGSVIKIIKTRSEILLNRKVEIGSLSYSLKGIIMHNVIIYDKSTDNTEPVLLKADEAVITFSLFSIIKKDFTIRTLFFRGLDINCTFGRDEKSNIENLAAEIKENIEKTGGDKNIRLSKILLKDCRLKLISPPLFIKPLEGEYKIDSTVSVSDNRLFRITDSKIILPSRRGTVYPELNIDITNEFIARGKAKLENTSLQWVYKFADEDPRLPFDVVSGQVNDLEITSKHIKGSAKVTSSLKNTKSPLFAEGSCTVTVDDRMVYIKEAQGKVNTSLSNVDILNISARKGEITKFIFTNAAFQLSDLKLFLDPLPSGISGFVKGHISYDSGVYNGRIEASNIAYKGKSEILSGINTSIEINHNQIKKENIQAKLFGSNSTISIATTDSRFKNFYMAVNCDRINLNAISFGDGTAEKKIDIPVTVSGKVIVNDLTYDNFYFKNTNLDFSASKKNVKILNISTSALSGAISGSGNIDISGTDPYIHTSLKFNGIKVNDIKFSDEKLNNRFFGFADGTANLNMAIRENIIDTIKGNAIFNVTKGKMVNTGIQDGLIIFLSELRYKLKNLEFNKIYGNIDISGRNFKINSIIFNSEDLRLSLQGNLNSDLTAKDINMKLEFNNHFIKDIPRPALAVFNEYSSGKWFIIPFLLNGNITESKNMKMLKKNQ